MTFVQTLGDSSWLFVAGGTDGGYATDTVERSAIQTDGSLGDFEDITPLPTALLGSGVSAADGTVVIGGGLANTGNSVGTTYIGRLTADDDFIWEEGPELSVGRYHVNFATVGGFIYATGGMTQSGTAHRFT